MPEVKRSSTHLMVKCCTPDRGDKNKGIAGHTSKKIGAAIIVCSVSNPRPFAMPSVTNLR